MRRIDPAWSERRNTAYRHAVANGLWKNTYAGSNPGEYWAEILPGLFRLQSGQQLEPRPHRHARAA